MDRRSFIKTSLLTAGTVLIGGKTAVAAEKTAGKAKAAGVPFIALNNGARIPQLGFGTWTLAENTRASVRAAALAGYRLFDTAQAYQNEAETWRGLKESGVPRRELFITTKISPGNMRKPPQRAAIDQSIELLGGEYLDLFLLHWPVQPHIQETWETLEDYVRKGLIKNLGLSNFNPHHIDALLKYAKVKPVLNQIEIHPYHSQGPNIEATRGYNIAVECWSPLAQGRAANDDAVIRRIAAKHGRSAAQVTLRWEIQHGLIVIPRSKNSAHIAENVGVFDFELDASDMADIAALNENKRINPKNDPDNFPW